MSDGPIATSIDELIAHLAALAVEQRADPRVVSPSATVLLRSGQSIVGQFLALNRSKRTALLSSDTRHYTLVRLEEVSAISVESSPVRDLFLEEQHLDPAAVPTKLELRRMVVELEEALTEKTGRPIRVELHWCDFVSPSSSDRGMSDLSSWLSSLRSTFMGLCEDELGRQALANISQVELSGGASNSARVDAATFRLTAKVRGDRVEQPTSSQIEAAL